jgi:putative aldouronate transport system permease protein
VYVNRHWPYECCKSHAAQGIFGSAWAGFDNFKFFFGSDDWLRVTLNTLFLNLLFLTMELAVALLLAIFLNEIGSLLFKKLAQSLILMPYFISWLVVSMMTFALFNTTDGLINHQLQSMGIPGPAWYNEPAYWPALLTFIRTWKFAGYYSIIFLAAMTAISSEYYEAARIDGATRLQQMRFITLPLLIPTAIILALLGLGRIFFGDFGMIYAIVGDNGVLFPTTDVIDTFAFRALRQLGNFGMASAVVLYQAVFGLVCVLVFNWLTKKIEPEARLF